MSRSHEATIPAARGFSSSSGGGLKTSTPASLELLYAAAAASDPFEGIASAMSFTKHLLMHNCDVWTPDWYNPTQDPQLGTTIMAVEYDGGVVLAADSRTSTGTYVANRVSDKITAVAPPYIYCARSGSAADTQMLADTVRRYVTALALETQRPATVRTAAALFRELIYQNKSRLTAGVICAGWDPLNGGQVYSITLGGTLVRQPFSIGGSGSTYIYGYCDASYRKGMNREACIAFCQQAASLAMARDGSSGGVLRMVCIEESGAQRLLFTEDQLPRGWQG
jgi:20S proteasome subunit beta 1